MTPFNLSRWAIEHPALVRYLMVALMLLGVASYFQLGQDEDPPFNFRVMVVQANWPGATAMQMAAQVADRLERIVQEVPNVRKTVSFSKPGHTTVIVEIGDDFDPKEVSQRFYTIRKKMMDMAGSLPLGVQGPFFNDDFGDTFGRPALPHAASQQRGQGGGLRSGAGTHLSGVVPNQTSPLWPNHGPDLGSDQRPESGGAGRQPSRRAFRDPASGDRPV